MTRLFSGPSSALTFVNTTILVVGGATSEALHSPHAFERTGAVITAVTGLFVVIQVLDELRMEQLLAHAAEGVSEPGTDAPALTRLAARIQQNADQRRASAVRQARLTLVVLIAAWLSLGEIVHGFGDIAFDAVNGRGKSAPAKAQIALPVLGHAPSKLTGRSSAPAQVANSATR
jgi:ABC-type nickel/cobalt efflux system permease component RcnA